MVMFMQQNTKLTSKNYHSQCIQFFIYKDSSNDSFMKFQQKKPHICLKYK